MAGVGVVAPLGAAETMEGAGGDDPRGMDEPREAIEFGAEAVEG